MFMWMKGMGRKLKSLSVSDHTIINKPAQYKKPVFLILIIIKIVNC